MLALVLARCLFPLVPSFLDNHVPFILGVSVALRLHLVALTFLILIDVFASWAGADGIFSIGSRT